MAVPEGMIVLLSDSDHSDDDITAAAPRPKPLECSVAAAVEMELRTREMLTAFTDDEMVDRQTGEGIYDATYIQPC